MAMIQRFSQRLGGGLYSIHTEHILDQRPGERYNPYIIHSTVAMIQKPNQRKRGGSREFERGEFSVEDFVRFGGRLWGIQGL